jgi:hypothetical protein
MDEATLKELASRYDLAALRSRVPRETVQSPGVDPAQQRADGWRLSMAETLRRADARPWRRAVFDAIEAPDMRVMIDTVECTTPAEALDCLLEHLAGNQLARLEEGPADLGFAVFQHPAAAPPALFFARDNLCVAVASFGARPVPVEPWARRLVQALSPILRR